MPRSFTFCYYNHGKGEYICLYPILIAFYVGMEIFVSYCCVPFCPYFWFFSVETEVCFRLLVTWFVVWFLCFFCISGSRIAVYGLRFAVRSSWFAVRGSWFAVRGSWFVVRGSQFVILVLRGRYGYRRHNELMAGVMDGWGRNNARMEPKLTINAPEVLKNTFTQTGGAGPSPSETLHTSSQNRFEWRPHINL